MARRISILVATLVAGCTTSVPLGQGRPIDERFVARAPITGPVGSVRPLSDGRVLAFEGTPRRLVLFDPSLQHRIVVAREGAAVGSATRGIGATLVPYIGDTTLMFVGD